MDGLWSLAIYHITIYVATYVYALSCMKVKASSVVDAKLTDVDGYVDTSKDFS